MSMSLPMITTFEELPNEVLLLICRYLSSIDTLSAFYGLNSRLSQTISGYYGYVFIGQASYERLTYMCSSIIPKIGLNICSLIVSDEWLGLVSKVFLEYFGERMASTFPYLERLTLINFTLNSLQIFLDCLKNLLKLTELNIHLMLEPLKNEKESWMLLHQLFTCNNNRLTSIIFNDDSTYFFCNIEDANESYPNIEKLTITLNSLHDFHNLLTILPKVHSINVIIEKSNIYISENQQILPAYELKQFCLQSLNCLWNLDQLTTVIKRLPNVENLSIKILSENDSRLAISREFFDQLSSLPLKVFDYLLFCFDYSIAKTTISSIWQQFRQEPICVENDNTTGCILYTLPCTPFELSIYYRFITAVGNSLLINNYGQTMKSVSLYDFPQDIAETYIILSKCRRIKRLIIRTDGNVKSSKSLFSM